MILLKDRGTIKWTSIMLPEHVQMLKEMWEETEKIEKPLLDPQELEQMNKKIEQAYQENLQISLSVYEDGFIKEVKGIITDIDIQQKQLKVQIKNDLTEMIAFKQIVSIKIS